MTRGAGYIEPYTCPICREEIDFLNEDSFKQCKYLYCEDCREEYLLEQRTQTIIDEYVEQCAEEFYSEWFESLNEDEKANILKNAFNMQYPKEIIFHSDMVKKHSIDKLKEKWAMQDTFSFADFIEERILKNDN